MSQYQVAIQAEVHKGEEGFEIDRWLMVGQAPYADGDVDESNVRDVLDNDDRTKALPEGEYFVYFTAEVDYEDHYSWEYGVTEVESILLGNDISIWKANNPIPEDRSIGRFI